MKGLNDYRFELVWASSLMGFKASDQIFYAIGGYFYIRHLGCGLGLKEGFVPGSFGVLG